MMNGKMLRDAFLSGANNIANHRQEVDALNVFPVPDGDTGTNMSMTIGAAKRELELVPDTATVAEVSQSAASALLRGARGNSGVILSLLFRGFAKGLAGKITAGPAELAHAFGLGVEAAYKAVMKPTEGTILTVSRLAADAVKAKAEDYGDDLSAFWDDLTEAGAAALLKTPELLPVLKKAGVVDAGGKGFLAVLEGMGSVVKTGQIVPPAGAAAAAAPSVPAGTVLDNNILNIKDELNGNITFTYCTEFIVLRSKEIEKSPVALRAYLDSIGDSVVVVDDENLIKAHVHTDNPGNALEEALTFGMLTNVKIDNMREQFERNKAASGKADAQEAPAEKKNFIYAPVDPDREFGFVAIAAGPGLEQLFLDLGVDHVVSGGQTMNPSTEDILEAVQATPAKTVFVLPNNKNIIMAAEQAVKLADRRVLVLQTKTIPQGLSSLLAYDSNADADQNFIEMTRAYEQVGTGMVTFAARDSDFDGHKIREGEILALENGKLSFVDKDAVHAATRLIKNLLRKNSDAAFVTIIHGEGATAEQAAEIEAAVHAKYSDIEVAVVDGGQPVYYYIISVE